MQFLRKYPVLVTGAAKAAGAKILPDIIRLVSKKDLGLNISEYEIPCRMIAKAMN